jgi:chemotaxis family two-component system sensor kinase Cph1
MQEGIARGERCINIIDKSLRAERLSSLQRAGIDIIAAQARGEFDLQTWEVAHALRGHFDRNRVLVQPERQAREGTSCHPMTADVSNQ